MTTHFALQQPRRKANRTIRVSLRVEDWPAADQALWQAAFAKGALFDESGLGAHLSTRSRTSFSNAYGRWLGYLAAFEPAALNETFEARVTRDRIVAFVKHVAETNVAASIAILLRQMRGALRLLGPDQDWSWLLTLTKRIEYQSEHRSKRDRLRTSDELFALGIRLMEEGEAAYEGGKRVTKKTALMYRDGLMIALLSVAPMRRRNLASLTPGQNLLRVGQGWVVALSASETKNRRALEYPLPQAVGNALERYLSTFRPVLFGSAKHAGLWASAKGVPLRGEAVYDAICRRTEAAFGQPVYPHLFRDGAATFWAQQVPAQVHAVSELLGHQPRMTQRHYNQADGIAAARKLEEALSRRGLS